MPAIKGLIRRRLLVNFRVDEEVMQSFLPTPFRPKLHSGYAIAGICLIRLEKIRPAGLSEAMGISSENAAHRIAVLWNDETGREREGVFIPRRDTGSRLNHLVGGRLFPGEHHFADFAVTDRDGEIFMKIHAEDGGMSVSLRGRETEKLPDDSCFVSVKEASLFFEKGSVGYSVTRNAKRLDGIRLVTEQWQVSPLAIEEVASSFFNDEAVFPKGSVEFDHALIMRDLVHRWEAVEDLATVGK